MKRIPLTRGKFALVDDADFGRLSEYSWNAQPHGKTWYASAPIKGTRSKVRMHQVVLSVPMGMVVDHINHNGLDNRRKNLRALTHRENIFHRRGPNTNSKSGVRGVHWDRRAQRWVVDVRGPIRLGAHFRSKTAAKLFVARLLTG